MRSDNGLKIGDLAKLTGCQVETIRYYEQAGLLPKTARSAGNYRLYDNRHVERLRFIRRCRSLDMPLDSIRLLLESQDAPDQNCCEVDALIDEHIRNVADRIAQLKALESQLRDLRGRCRNPRTAKDCRILQRLSGDDAYPFTKLP